ncbi:MAG: ankyrin repeat domain-containing protein, partial [Campylobacterota bacterium]|nr:ankyrin repeat domain-containing protein [Campylobacterota bacterium]
MLGELFKREHSNVTFLQEILHKEPNWDWLIEGLDKEIIDINHQDKDGNTFLIKCLKVSKFKSAVWLINHNADTTIKNNDKKTAINIAIEKNNLIVVKELLDLNKIDVNQKDIDGRSL